MQAGIDIALVTGASSGIGAEIARQLAAQRIDLVISARRADRLAALREELISAHGIRVEVIENDLNLADGAQRLVAALDERKIVPTVLINNAGFGFHGEFLGQTTEEIESVLQVNIRAMTILCRLLGERMKAAGRGFILNVASFAALAPIPQYAVYSGTKGYVVAFSQALQHELRRSGVKVSVLAPGFTRTEFHEVAHHQKNWLIRSTELTAPHVARAGLAGLRRGKLLIVPGLWYKINSILMRIAPRTLISSLTAAIAK